MSVVSEILNGKVPEVPFTVKVEDSSIIKLSVAAVIAATIIILVAALVKRKN
jgi:hypothetical protein